MSFLKFGFNQALLQTLHENAYEHPTLIQEQVIPLVLEGKDVVARAQTGSGKTASFVLPIIEKLIVLKSEGKPKIKVLVLTPTRELSVQVAQTFILFFESLHVKPKVVNLIGGERIGEQLYDIQQGCDVVVATSGRLLDVMRKQQINLSHVCFFVLDEADKMLDLGFEQELALVLEALPQKRQNLLFSATYPPKMQDIAQKVTQAPTMVSVEKEMNIFEEIHQRAICVNHENRSPLLRHLLHVNKWERILVFMGNKRAADNSAMKFRKHGFLAESFHGDLVQEGRTWVLDAFKKGEVKILFATDIAARGLHIEGISCVINFDLPRSVDDYVHRIGRTGRAGKKGEAISFIGHEDKAHFELIQKRLHFLLPQEEIEGYALTGEAVAVEKGKAPVKGKRKSKKDKLRESLS